MTKANLVPSWTKNMGSDPSLRNFCCHGNSATRGLTPCFLRLTFVLIVLATPLYAQEEREAFTVEGTVAAWLLRPSGNVLSNGNAIDLRTDFGMSSRRTSPYIRVIFKPSQKNRAVFETIPYRL